MLVFLCLKLKESGRQFCGCMTRNAIDRTVARALITIFGLQSVDFRQLGLSLYILKLIMPLLMQSHVKVTTAVLGLFQ